jgi:tetratricopeptide (TPR) repeat protein
MNKMLPFFLVAAVCLVSGARLFGAETNSISSSTNTDAMVNAFLQIQAQLHETQMMVESNREETIAALQRNAEAMNARIQLLQQTLANQRASEMESAREVEQLMLVLAGIGMLALAAVLTMIFFQLRAATRLMELAMSSPALNPARALPVVETAGALPASARATVEFSNARLLGVVERLEKRILEMEQTTRTPLNGTHSPDVSQKNGETPGERQVADLIAQGQLFLDTNEPEKALDCFDAALEIQPELVEALIKKGDALEKLERANEAIACYDRAIEADGSATIALLQKGGLLNRLARHEEALQCYERALKTQEKQI